MIHKYKISGRYKEQEVEETVEAYSKQQAKMKAGFNLGLGGSTLKEFMKSNSIKVRETK